MTTETPANAAPEKKPRKRLRKVLLIGAAVLLIIVIALVVFINAIAKTAIQEGATYALGVSTKVEGVDLSFLGGSAEIKGLKIANPEGFGDGNFLDLGRAYVSLSPGSVLTDTIVVRDIVVESPVLRIRQKGLKTNVSAILENINKLAPPEEGGEQPAAPKAQAKKYKIGNIKLTGARVEYSIVGTPVVPVPLPPIEIKGIDSADGTGVTIGKVIQQVLAAMVKSAGEAGAGVIPKDVTDAVGKTAAEAKAAVDTTVKGATDAVKGIGNAFRGLGGKKEEQK